MGAHRRIFPLKRHMRYGRSEGEAAGGPRAGEGSRMELGLGKVALVTGRAVASAAASRWRLRPKVATSC